MRFLTKPLNAKRYNTAQTIHNYQVRSKYDAANNNLGAKRAGSSMGVEPKEPAL